MKRLTTRGRATAEAIRDREDFTTNGALYGTSENWHGSGYLSGEDQNVWQEEAGQIKYAVYSYATPIAWWTEQNGWHRVVQKFSRTTSKHQGNLYLIDEETQS